MSADKQSSSDTECPQRPVFLEERHTLYETLGPKGGELGAERHANRKTSAEQSVVFNTALHEQLRASGLVKGSTYDSAMAALRKFREQKEIT